MRRCVLRAATVLTAVPLVCCGGSAPRPGRLPVLKGLELAREHVSIAGETRPALVVVQEAQIWRRPVQAVDGAWLELAVGLRCLGLPCRGAATFRVEASGAAGRRTLWQKRLAGSTLGWEEARIELTGRERELVFETRREGPDLEEGEVEGQVGGPQAVWAEPTLVTPSRRRLPNVVLVSIDTLRADRLGCYGYPRATSPHLDALAAQGVRFANAISQSPWTTPATMSLLTGLYPSHHGVTQGIDVANYDWERYRHLSESVTTLAEALQQAGYATRALTGGGTVGAEIGFAQGFDVYRAGAPKLDPEARAMETLRGWLREASGEPFFLFFQTFEVHAPYIRASLVRDTLDPSQRAALAERWRLQRDWDEVQQTLVTAFEDLLLDMDLYRADVTSALYDAGIRHADAFIGRLLGELSSLGIADRTLVVVTSDHGEEFGEHDPRRFYDAHCTTQYDELIRVPLLFRLPGGRRAGTAVDQQVELVDVAPTILDLAGVPAPAGISGRSLVPLIDGRTIEERAALSEATCMGPEIKALRSPAFKYVVAFRPTGDDRRGIPGPVEWEKLFDLRADAAERRGLEADERRLGALRGELRRRVTAAARGPASGGLSPESLEAMRALGYVR